MNIQVEIMNEIITAVHPQVHQDVVHYIGIETVDVVDEVEITIGNIVTEIEIVIDREIAIDQEISLEISHVIDPKIDLGQGQKMKNIGDG